MTGKKTARRRAASPAAKSFPLPASYLRALRETTDEIRLDWRKLWRREPAMWPGTIQLFRSTEVAAENARLNGMLVPEQRDRHYFVGTNTCGIVFALDRRGRVVIFDECEMDDPIVIARTFRKLMQARARAETKPAQASVDRKLAKRWERIEEHIRSTAFFRLERVEGLLYELVYDYQRLGKDAELRARLDSLRKRHASKKGMLARLRAKGFLPADQVKRLTSRA